MNCKVTAALLLSIILILSPLSIVFPQEWSVNPALTGMIQKEHLDDNWGFDIFTDIQPTKYPVLLRLAYSHYWGNSASDKLFFGTTDSYSYEPSIIIRPTFRKVWQPYFGLGMAYHSPHTIKIADFSLDVLNELKQTGFGEISEGNGLFYTFGFFVIATPRVSIFVNYKLSTYKPDITKRITDNTTGDIVAEHSKIWENYEMTLKYYSIGFRLHILKPRSR